jgi:hypothetical protein
MFALFLLFHAVAFAANLPTVTVEHLYFLATRGEQVRKLTSENMVEYCLAQKLGGTTFENLYEQLMSIRIDLMKLVNLDELPVQDARVVAQRKKRDEYEKLLFEEVRKIQQGIVREGAIADETLRAIARAQTGR